MFARMLCPYRKMECAKGVGRSIRIIHFPLVGKYFCPNALPLQQKQKMEKNGTAFKLIYLTVERRSINPWHRPHFRGIRPREDRETGDDR